MTIIYSSKPLRDRDPHDFYPTPKELIRAILEDFSTKHSSPKSILDPGCGDGVWGEIAREFYPNAKIKGIDIRELPKNPAYDYWETMDFMNFNFAGGYDLVIGNPPFKYAEQFLEKCIGANAVIFLLRSSFLESKKRYQKYYSGSKPNFIPTEVKISTRRISFTGNKKSDNTMYGVYYWMRTNLKSPTVLSWLDWEYDK